MVMVVRIVIIMVVTNGIIVRFGFLGPRTRNA